MLRLRMCLVQLRVQLAQLKDPVCCNNKPITLFSLQRGVWLLGKYWAKKTTSSFETSTYSLELHLLLLKANMTVDVDNGYSVESRGRRDGICKFAS